MSENFKFFQHRECEFFPCPKRIMKRTLTACSAIVRFMLSERNAAAISSI